MPKIILHLCLLLLLTLSNPGFARERILDYFSDIQVARDGSMLVEEHIEVEAEGNKTSPPTTKTGWATVTGLTSNYWMCAATATPSPTILRPRATASASMPATKM